MVGRGPCPCLDSQSRCCVPTRLPRILSHRTTSTDHELHRFHRFKMSELQLAVISAADNSRIDNNDNNNLPASSPPSYSVQNVACPIDEDEVAIEAFRKRYGANKLPDEHIGEWTAKNAGTPLVVFVRLLLLRLDVHSADDGLQTFPNAPLLAILYTTRQIPSLTKVALLLAVASLAASCRQLLHGLGTRTLLTTYGRRIMGRLPRKRE